MRTIISGGRDYQMTTADYAFLDTLKSRITEVVSGGAKGADEGGERWANKNGIPVKLFPANWDRNGAAAGPIRNRKMAKYAQALVVFPGGNGTFNMEMEAERRNLKIIYCPKRSRY